MNNTTIIKNTTVINAVKRENRSIGGRSQTIVVNEGPRVEEVQKATGKKFTTVSVQEADRRTVVPATIRHKPGESQDNIKPPSVQDRPKSGRGQTPGISGEKQKDQSPSKGGLTPPPGRTPPNAPVARPPARGQPEGKEKAKAQKNGTDKDHNKDRP